MTDFCCQGPRDLHSRLHFLGLHDWANVVCWRCDCKLLREQGNGIAHSWSTTLVWSEKAIEDRSTASSPSSTRWPQISCIRLWHHPKHYFQAMHCCCCPHKQYATIDNGQCTAQCFPIISNNPKMSFLFFLSLLLLLQITVDKRWSSHRTTRYC